MVRYLALLCCFASLSTMGCPFLTQKEAVQNGTNYLNEVSRLLNRGSEHCKSLGKKLDFIQSNIEKLKTVESSKDPNFERESITSTLIGIQESLGEIIQAPADCYDNKKASFLKNTIMAGISVSSIVAAANPATMGIGLTGMAVQPITNAWLEKALDPSLKGVFQKGDLKSEEEFNVIACLFLQVEEDTWSCRDSSSKLDPSRNLKAKAYSELVNLMKPGIKEKTADYEKTIKKNSHPSFKGEEVKDFRAEHFDTVLLPQLRACGLMMGAFFSQLGENNKISQYGFEKIKMNGIINGSRGF